MKKLISFVLALTLLLSLTACGEANQKPGNNEGEVTWPQYPVTLYCAASAGGGTDLAARVMAEELSTYGSSSFGVVNLTDGGGVVAYETVKNSDSEVCDEMIFYLSGIYVTYLAGAMNINPVDDFVTVFCATNDTSYYMVTRPDAPWDDFASLLAYTKEHPGEVTIGTPSAACLTTLQISYLEEQTGINWKIVAAESDSVAIGQVIGGNLDLYLTNQSTTQSYYEAGEIKVLCNIHGHNESASDLLNSVPSLADLGYEDCTIKNNFTVLAPKGADEKVYAKMNEWFVKAFASERVQSDFAARNVMYTSVGDLETTLSVCNDTMAELSGLWDSYIQKYGA